MHAPTSCILHERVHQTYNRWRSCLLPKGERLSSRNECANSTLNHNETVLLAEVSYSIFATRQQEEASHSQTIHLGRCIWINRLPSATAKTTTSQKAPTASGYQRARCDGRKALVEQILVDVATVQTMAPSHGHGPGLPQSTQHRRAATS